MVKLAFKERVPNSCAAVVGSGNISNLSKLLCMSLFPARMKKFYSKMKTLEWPKHFSHCKAMGIFSVAQGQLTPQSMVESGRISNSCDTLWLSSLPAKMKKIQSKMMVLEC